MKRARSDAAGGAMHQRALLPLLAVLCAVVLCGCPPTRPKPEPKDNEAKEAKPGSGSPEHAPADATKSSKPGDEKVPPQPQQQTGAEQEQAARLARAGALIGENRFDEAAAAREEVMRSEPTDAQRGRAAQLQTVLEDRRRAWNELEAAVRKLTSENRDEVLAAQNRLFERADLALPLLERATSGEDPKLVAAALDTLARLRRPEQALPIMVAVLRRPEQQSSWPEATGAIESVASPGAGEPLLLLALAADRAEQRIAALQALARVVDPPQRTIVALLPWIHQDGPELPAALEAVAHAVEVHHQHDLGTRRGLEGALAPEQLEQLDELPARLTQILAASGTSPSGTGASGEAARAARRLAVATRQVPAEPLAGVKLLAYSVQLEESPAAAVLDGAWDTTDTKQMWRYDSGKEGSIVLDLGAVRTVAGVRIWNLNEPGAAHRGWKDVEVYVGDLPEALGSPVATGQSPKGPGAAGVPDYSATIPVEFRTGRYVRLRAASVWTRDNNNGLTEVQVLGY